MSTLQQTKPRWANQSITDESGRPGTVRSNVGCEAIDDPWTNRTAGLPSGVSTYFSQRNRRTSPPGVFFFAQCSTPVTCVALSIGCLIDFRAGLADDPSPALLLRTEECAEFRGRRADDLDAGCGHVGLHFVGRERAHDLALQLVDDRRRCTLRRHQSHPYISLVSRHTG